MDKPTRWRAKHHFPIVKQTRIEGCPACQPEELFAGTMTGTPTLLEMVIYPGGRHHFFEKGRPSHRKDMLERLAEWLCRWIDQPVPDAGKDGAAPSDAGQPRAS